MATIFGLPLEVREMIYQHFTAPTNLAWTLTDQGLVFQAPIWEGRDGQAPAAELIEPAGRVLRQLVCELRRANRELSERRTFLEDHPTISPDQIRRPGFHLKQWVEVLETPRFAKVHNCAKLCIATSTFDTSICPEHMREQLDDLICEFRNTARPCVERSAMVEASAVVCKANAMLRKELVAYWSRKSHNSIYALRSARLQGRDTCGPIQSRQFMMQPTPECAKS